MNDTKSHKETVNFQTLIQYSNKSWFNLSCKLSNKTNNNFNHNESKQLIVVGTFWSIPTVFFIWKGKNYENSSSIM